MSVIYSWAMPWNEQIDTDLVTERIKKHAPALLERFELEQILTPKRVISLHLNGSISEEEMLDYVAGYCYFGIPVTQLKEEPGLEPEEGSEADLFRMVYRGLLPLSFIDRVDERRVELGYLGIGCHYVDNRDFNVFTDVAGGFTPFIESPKNDSNPYAWAETCGKNSSLYLQTRTLESRRKMRYFHDFITDKALDWTIVNYIDLPESPADPDNPSMPEPAERISHEKPVALLVTGNDIYNRKIDFFFELDDAEDPVLGGNSIMDFSLISENMFAWCIHTRLIKEGLIDQVKSDKFVYSIENYHYNEDKLLKALLYQEIGCLMRMSIEKSIAKHYNMIIDWVFSDQAKSNEYIKRVHELGDAVHVAEYDPEAHANAAIEAGED